MLAIMLKHGACLTDGHCVTQQRQAAAATVAGYGCSQAVSHVRVSSSNRKLIHGNLLRQADSHAPAKGTPSYQACCILAHSSPETAKQQGIQQQHTFI